jgi:hypothetical protein
MQVREISVTYGGKLNMGDFNSAHIEITFSALLEEGDNHDECARTLMLDARHEVQERAKELFKKRGARVDEIFAGLPVDVQKQIVN